MSRIRFVLPLVAGAAVALFSCGEPSSPLSSTPFVTAPSLATTSASCTVHGLYSLAISYFSQHQQSAVADTLSAMYFECGAGDSVAVRAGGWTLLSAVEEAIGAGSAGASSDGAGFANGVITYMCQWTWSDDLCSPQPAAVTAEALGGQGIFAVRGHGATDIVAHGKVPFTFQGVPNNALWGVQTSTTWQDATGAPVILVYGNPSTLSVADLSLGDLAFRLHTFPDVPGFKDGELHVGVCYDQDVDLAGAGLANFMQREGTLLQPWAPTFQGCRPVSMASRGNGNAFEGLLAMAAQAFLPRPLSAATVLGNPPSTGGSPIDFSHFAPVATGTSGGRLEFVTPPSDGTDGIALSTIRVAAVSDGGTPAERVRIQLYLKHNKGIPAGATFCDPAGGPCQDTATTVEGLDGYGTLASFTDATLYKPGGYIVCAKAVSSLADPEGDPLTFQDVCADMIHIKKHAE